MPRERLPHRHPSITRRVEHGAHSLLVTFGLDDFGRIREVFTSSFKTGQDLNLLAEDASIALSQWLQRGAEIADVAKSLGEPPSLLGTIAQAGAALQAELDAEGAP